MPIPSKIIAVEEHFSTPEFPGLPLAEIYDVGERRIDAMNVAGIDVQVISLAAPGIQGMVDASNARRNAAATNELMAQIAQRFPGRFACLACLPTQDPTAAANELERAVLQFGAKGALINGHTHGQYLDEDQFSPIWEQAATLDVPIYLHPSRAYRAWDILEGYPELSMAAWGWSAETGAHALRVLLSGVFDRYPTARIILGHMGESIPLYIARIDSRLRHVIAKRGLRLGSISDYLRRNVVITTSGVCSDAALRCAMDAMGGPDSVLFSVDYPYESNIEAANWLRSAEFSANVISAIAHRNAERLFKLEAQPPMRRQEPLAIRSAPIS
ncbi:2,3-dihydroxybenzoate decarboxylase [Bradyrhizobium sp. USDA 4449]